MLYADKVENFSFFSKSIPELFDDIPFIPLKHLQIDF